MEEKERKEKLKAGKEKLAQFQKKKKSRKQKPGDQKTIDPDFVGGEVLGITPESGAGFVYDSDNQTLSSCSEEDAESVEGNTSKEYVKIRSQLQEKSQRVGELEELLAGKQLALDKVLQENGELQRLSQTKPKDVSEDGDNLSNQDTQGESEDISCRTQKRPAEVDVVVVKDLVQQVQWLQLQLKQAGNSLQSRNEKQNATLSALQEAKSEIQDLQENITQKDVVVRDLVEKLQLVSLELNKTKAAQDKEQLLLGEKSLEIQRENQDKIDSLEQDNTALCTKLKSTENKLESFLEEIESLSRHKISLEIRLESVEKLHESSVIEFQSEIDTLRKDLDGLHKEKDSLLEIGDRKTSELISVCEKLEQLENLKTSTEQQCSDLTLENEKLLEENESLVKQMTAIKEDSSMYQSLISNYEDKISQSGEVLEENHSLRFQNDDLNNKINNQKDIIASFRSDIAALTSENVKLVDQLQEMTSSFKEKNVELDAVKIEQRDLLALCEERKKMLEEIQEQNDKYMSVNLSLEQDLAKLKQELSESASECEMQKKENSELQKKLMQQISHTEGETVISETILPQVHEVLHTQHTSKEESMPDCSKKDLMIPKFVKEVHSSIQVPNPETVYENGANINTTSGNDKETISLLQSEIDTLRAEVYALRNANILSYDRKYVTNSPTIEATPSTRNLNECDVVETFTNDTAYETQSFDQNPDVLYVEPDVMQPFEDCEKREELTEDNFKLKSRECEMLKTEVQNLQMQIQRMKSLDRSVPDIIDNVSEVKTDEIGKDEVDNLHSDLEVSRLNLCSLDASGMDVNMHASSYPTTQWDDPLVPCSVNVLGNDFNEFQQVSSEPDIACQVKDSLCSDGLDTRSKHGEKLNMELSRQQKESAFLNDIVAQINKEKNDILELYRQEKIDKEKTVEELEKISKTNNELENELKNCKELVTKYQSNLKQMQAMLQAEKTQIDELASDNEKIIWERNEFELRLNDIEVEFSNMKSTKCDLEYKEEQVREELNRVKERLEYLESCENDIFEMKEIVDKLQEEKEAIIKDNETLQCNVAAKVDENDKVIETMESLYMENAELVTKSHILTQDKVNLTSQLNELKHVNTVNEKQLKELVKEKEEEESRFLGELGGLDEENSTLKTKLKSNETEMELLRNEIDRLNNFIPNIDEQVEGISVLKQRNSELEVKFEETSKENEDLVNELLINQCKLEEMQSDILMVTSKCDELQSIIDDMDDEKTSLLDNLEKLKEESESKLMDKDNIIQKYEMQLDALDNENATLKTQVMSLKQDLHEILEQSQTLDEDYTMQTDATSKLKLKNEKLEEEAASNQSKITELEHDMLDLVNQVQLYDNTMSEKLDLATRLEEQVKSLLSENTTLNAKCGSLEHDLVELKTKESYVSEQLKIYESNYASNENSTGELSRVTSQLELEVKYKLKAQSDAEKLSIQVDTVVLENKELKSELDHIKQELNEIMTARNDEKGKIMKMNEELRKAETERDEILLEYHGVYTNVNVVVDENEALKSEVQKLSMDLAAISDNRNHIRSQVEVLAAETEALRSERDMHLSEIKKLENKMKDMTVTEKQLQKKNTELSQQNTLTLKKCEHLESQNKKLQEQNDEIRQQSIMFQDKLSKLDKALEYNVETQEENAKLSKKLGDLRSHVDELQKQRLELEGVVGELTNMLHDMQTKYEEVKSEMESTKKKCDKEINQLQSHLLDMNKDVTELRKVLDVMESEMYHVHEEKEVLKENYEQQQTQLVEAVEAKEVLLKRLSDKQQKDLKNMKMVNMLNQERQELSQCTENESVDGMNSQLLNDDVGANTGPLLLGRSSNVIDQTEALDDQNVPSFEGVLNLFPFSQPSIKVTNCQVQTNISIGEFEHSGELVDDNGEVVEISKDGTSVVHSSTQTLSEEESLREYANLSTTYSDTSLRESNEASCEDGLNSKGLNLDNSRDDLMLFPGLDQLNLSNIKPVSKNQILVNCVACQCDILTGEENYQQTDNEMNNIAISREGKSGLNDTIDNLSVASGDSGLFSSCRKEEERVSDPSEQNIPDSMQDSYIKTNETSCQTDLDYQSEFMNEVQTAIQDMNESLDIRQNHITAQENDYERKVKHMEYELEEKYEQRFRDREAEIAVKADRDKKRHADEVELEAKRAIEKVKVEKDQQFVIALQQVRADIANKSKKKKKKISTRRAVSQELPESVMEPADDTSITENQEQDVNQLKQDNQELAQARDDLLQKINVTQLEQEDFREKLYCIMGEHSNLRDQSQSPNQQALQMAPSFLDWDLSPEVSFESVRSSFEVKSLDPCTSCLNEECLSVRMKYEQLFEKIQRFLKERPSEQLQEKSYPENMSDSDEENVFSSNSQKQTIPHKTKSIGEEEDEDRFIEHSEPDDQMLQRLTSIHLEHWTKGVKPKDNDNTEARDSFVLETNDTDESLNNDIGMDDIIKELVTESQTKSFNSIGSMSEPLKQATRKWSDNKRFTFTRDFSPIDSDKSPEGVNDSNVPPFSHCTSSVSYSAMEEGHFSEDEQDGVFVASHSRKRHYSEGDIQLEKDNQSNLTSQSDNLEGHFVMERVHAQSEPPTSDRYQNTNTEERKKEVFEDSVDEKVTTKDQKSISKVRPNTPKAKKVKIDAENKFVVEDSNKRGKGQRSNLSLSQTIETDLMSGKDNGDFFEESLTCNDDDDRIDSGDILEKIRNENDSETNLAVGYSQSGTDGSFHEDLVLTTTGTDFIQETQPESLQALSTDVMEASIGKINTNTLFDMLNSICPGTDPSRHPDFRNDTEIIETITNPSEATVCESADKVECTKIEDGAEKQQRCGITLLDLEKQVAEGNLKQLEVTSSDAINSQALEIKKLRSCLDETSSELAAAMDTNERITSENNGLTDIIAQLQQHVQRLEESSETDHHKSNMVHLEQEIIILSQRNQELLSSNEAVSSEKDMLDSQIKDLLEKLNEIDDAVTEKDELFAKARDEMKRLNEENDRLEGILAGQSQLKAELNQLIVEKDKLLEEAMKEKLENTALLENKLDVENALIKQTDMYNNLQKKYDALQNEIHDNTKVLDDEVLSLKNEKMQLSSNLLKEKERFDGIVDELSKQKEENDKLNKVIQERNNQLENQKEELAHTMKTNESLKEKISGFEESVNVLNEDLKHKDLVLKETLVEKETIISQLQSSIDKADKLSKEVELQQGQIVEYVKEVEVLKEERVCLDAVQRENIAMKTMLDSSKNINVEHEWIIKDLRNQVENLQKENESMLGSGKDLDKDHELTIKELRAEVESLQKENETYCKTIETLKTSMTVLERMDNNDCNSETKSEHSDTDQQILEDFKDTLKLLQEEKVSLQRQSTEEKTYLLDENRSLAEEVDRLKEEKILLEKAIKSQEASLRKENTDILSMYSDLRNEVEVLVISKHDLEVELVALKNLLEHGDPSLVNLPQKSGRELTLQDLEDMEELKTSIEQLKLEMKEKDDYVRKLEEHFLHVDRGLPGFTSSPKPSNSKGEPVLSRSFKHKKLMQIGKRAFSHDVPFVSVKVFDELEEEKDFNNAGQEQDDSLHTSDLDQSTSNVSETQFTDKLNRDINLLTSSHMSDSRSVNSLSDSFDSAKIRSGLTPQEDGHLALELKQFELVDEISKLRKDFRETKAVYAQETALLSEALEKEKAYKDYLQSGRGRTTSDPSGNQFLNKELSKDLVRLRQDLAVLREENKLLKMENDRWLSQLKEQEKIVNDLKERLYRNTSGIEEIEEIFGRQLALLQKQREELLDKLRFRENENCKLSAVIGEKSVMEETLRREKDELTAKLNERSDVENELMEKKQSLAILKSKQTELEEVIYQKDLNERELMKQKRLLEEELHDIEAKFKDREENLGFEKNQLLDELRVKKSPKLSISESEQDDRSVCSDSSSFSDRHINNLELTLEEVEKQHAEAVRILRNQLKSKYRSRERSLRQDHRTGLERLQSDFEKQVM